MKLFRNTPFFIQSILVAGMLSACQNENNMPVAPQVPSAPSDQNARTSVATGALIKDGNTDLAYSSQYQTLLSKETHANCYYEFTYAPQLITAKGYKYGNPSTECKYILDPYGRCVQSATYWETYIYEYNASGQLTGFYNKNQPNERRELSYAADANGWKKSLSQVTFYNESGVKTKELKFSYGTAAGLIPDKHPLTPDILPAEVSKYLPIFGNFNTNLVKVLIEDKYLANGQKASSNTYMYSYTFDYAGRVNNITMKKTNGTLVSSTDRKYFVPTYKF
ncbi:hypothetical protein [Dyadobacter sp. OTU695]|uniref:hypothetical protein n=1 Tax=Dyadobacter sp. OTU695 TaxID=3043860 RepID=UPI00313EAE15